jgi:hypothetical protein
VNIDVTPGVASQGSGTQPKAMPSVRPAITPSPRPFINDATTMPNVGRVSVGCFACAIVSLVHMLSDVLSRSSRFHSFGRIH